MRPNNVSPQLNSRVELIKDPTVKGTVTINDRSTLSKLLNTLPPTNKAYLTMHPSEWVLSSGLSKTK